MTLFWVGNASQATRPTGAQGMAHAGGDSVVSEVVRNRRICLIFPPTFDGFGDIVAWSNFAAFGDASTCFPRAASLSHK
jgi:hypothetical protein